MIEEECNMEQEILLTEQEQKFLMELLDEQLMDSNYSQTSIAIMNNIYRKLVNEEN